MSRSGIGARGLRCVNDIKGALIAFFTRQPVKDNKLRLDQHSFQAWI